MKEPHQAFRNPLPLSAGKNEFARKKKKRVGGGEKRGSEKRATSVKSHGSLEGNQTEETSIKEKKLNTGKAAIHVPQTGRAQAWGGKKGTSRGYQRRNKPTGGEVGRNGVLGEVFGEEVEKGGKRGKKKKQTGGEK